MGECQERQAKCSRLSFAPPFGALRSLRTMAPNLVETFRRETLKATRLFHGEMRLFVGFDQSHESFKAVTICGSCFGIPQALNFKQSGLVIGVGIDGSLLFQGADSH